MAVPGNFPKNRRFLTTFYTQKGKCNKLIENSPIRVNFRNFQTFTICGFATENSCYIIVANFKTKSNNDKAATPKPAR